MTSPPAQPLYFGPQDRALFGWLHRPAAGPARNIGIVTCGPTGYEAICTHRTYRYFAESAAARGFPTLRFDYDGTGDSSGRALDPDRLGHWLRSIEAAIETLRAQTGVDRVCLFGVRVGATLASVAAQGRSDVHAMIALAPIVKVSAYLRELRALALSRPQSSPPPDVVIEAGLQEAAGFATTEETRTALAKVNLLELEAAPAPNMLILERNDLTVKDTWSQRLVSQGAQVHNERLEGYIDMMRDAHSSQVPTQSIEKALDWLNSLAAPAVAPVQAPPTMAPSAQFVDDDRQVRETALFLDEHRLVFGIVSEPVEPSGAIRDVVVLLNSGTIHHIGPSRLYVTIARRCAAKGMAVARIDLSGVGDSGVRDGAEWNAPYSDSAKVDVKHVVQFAQQRFPGAQVHLIGVCSGAYHGLKAAVAGTSLRSVVMVNPLIFFWKPGMSLEYADFQIASHTSYYARRATSLSSWLGLLTGRVNVVNAARVLSKRFNMRARDVLRDVGRSLGMRLQDDLASELLRVARQSIDMFFVFSASDPGHSLLREQGGHVVGKLARRQHLRIAIVPGADHTFTARWNREQLITLLMAHLERHATQR